MIRQFSTKQLESCSMRVDSIKLSNLLIFGLVATKMYILDLSSLFHCYLQDIEWDKAWRLL